MVIAGPNGVGKSTLLYAVRNGSGVITPNTRFLYQGPHRVLRRTAIQRRWLSGATRWMSDLLSGGGDVSGYEGLSFPNSSRTPDNVDEAGSTIKYTLGKIENRRQAILAKVVDVHSSQKIPLDTTKLPDVYEPLRTLTQYLLPHLVFNRIDFESEDNIRCLWTRTDDLGTMELDIDDLSSGEKAIVILFISLLEGQIREKLQELENLALKEPVAPAASEDLVVLIDEPEQHLHPDLQAKILSYMRKTTRDSKVQFVITTHSPTILDQAFDDELFALYSPSADVGENQLRRIATNAEKLETLKQLTGSAYFLTTGRVIVCIEGEPGADIAQASDIGLLETMYPRATAFTLVPTRGKSNVIGTVQSLREYISGEAFRITVRGLVDADQTEALPEGIEMLPVCMIENLLLDPQVLFEYASSLPLPQFANVAAVEGELANITGSLREEEIALRARRSIKGWTVRVGGASLPEIKADHAAQMERLRALLPSDAELEAEIARVAGVVDRLIAEGKALDRFRGKVILREFYQRHVSAKNVGYKPMCLELAKRLALAEKIGPRLDPVFDRLKS